MRRPIALGAWGWLPLIFLVTTVARPYSVLTHEAIIDTVWIGSIKPLLVAAYPKSTEEELRRANAFAYGGAIIQDFGYYPKGSHLFSDLTHYVRTGEFIVNLTAEAHNLNEYAFALGSLAHYAADEQGHSIAVNRTVGILFPELARKFGPVVTYEDNPSAHVKTEFAFDVVQVARGYYAPEAYHNFIGFEVAKPVLERAFEKTYCLRLEDLFSNLNTAVGTYRHVVGKTIPKATEVAWVMKKHALTKELGGSETEARRRFLYYLSRADYEKEWGKDYKSPGAIDRFLAFLLRLIPKVGPLRSLAFRVPTPQAEDLFMKSFDAAVEQYKRLLKSAGEHKLNLRELNLDTGRPPSEDRYFLAEETKLMWAEKLKGAGCPLTR